MTLELYAKLGVKGTSIRAVADHADVSRGTILNHFGTADGLLVAVLDRVVERMEYPDERILDGLHGRDERVRAYVLALVAFYERSRPWWSIFESEQHGPEFQRRESEYWESLARLQSAALGPALANDPEANATLMSLIHPATVGTFLWSFERAGLEKPRARALLGDLAVEAIRRIGGHSTKGGTH